MKKIFVYFSILTCIVFMGCSDILDTIPTNRLSAEVFWQTETDAEYGANAVYRFLEAPGTVLGRDQMSDIARSNFDTSDESRVELDIADPQTGIFQNTWNDMYRGIRRCNDYMANVDRITPVNAAKLDRLTAEVRTLRCYFYSRLVSYFGDVPLVTTPIGISESKSLTRTPVSEIYDFISKEITDVVEALPPTTTEKGRVTKGAAYGILARTMLFAAGNVTGTDSRSQAYFERAKAAADAVIALDVYDLYPSYQNLFAYDAENNVEVVFDRQYMKDVAANGVFGNFGARSLGGNGSAMSPALVLVDEYENKDGTKFVPSNDPAAMENQYIDRDPRLSYTVYVPGDILVDGSVYDSRPWTGTQDSPAGGYQASKTGLVPRKYINPEDKDARANCGINLILIRYAEILLIAAEARIELNTELSTARTYINKVRQRPDVMMPVIPDGMTQAQLREAVRHERMVELALEGHRFFDIRRWEIAEQVCTNTTQFMGMRYVSEDGARVEYMTSEYFRTFGLRSYLWPIPYNERQLNPNLTQNNGWGE